MKYNIVFENELWVCYEPIDFEAGKRLADNANWCTASKDIYLKYYRKRGTVYYCMHKEDASIAVGLHFIKGKIVEHVNKDCWSYHNLHTQDLPKNIVSKLRQHHIKNYKVNQEGATLV